MGNALDSFLQVINVGNLIEMKDKLGFIINSSTFILDMDTMLEECAAC